MITHYDLFAGIGGFSLALEEVFNDRAIRHIFCKWESFPTAVLKKHWPDATYYGDIADLVTDTGRARLEETRAGQQAAGRRRGTSDDRYKWPEMFEVIRNVKPTWVIAENVRGLATWNDGMVLEKVCTDLETQGYEVQPFIVPAVAVNAPHRRDRVWIIANNQSNRQLPGMGLERQSVKKTAEQRHEDSDAKNAERQRSGGRSKSPRQVLAGQSTQTKNPQSNWPNWSRDWKEVAFATCDASMDDGLPRSVDGVPYTRPKWRQESLKAYGNAIVPEVAIEIMRAIKVSEAVS